MMFIIRCPCLGEWHGILVLLPSSPLTLFPVYEKLWSAHLCPLLLALLAHVYMHAPLIHA